MVFAHRENGAARRALVVGGSMSGLFAAHLLLRAGWDVAVFERVESQLSGRGADIVAQPELIARLGDLGIDTSALGVQVTARKLLDARGALAASLDCPQVMTSWERVYRALRDCLPRERYHRGAGVARFVETADGVTLHFIDGSAATGDLVIGADGIRSTIRQQCLPQLGPLYAGYVAWRALVPEEAFPAAIHREIFGYMTYCLPPGEQFLGYPVAGPHDDVAAGRRRFNVIWYRPASEAHELPALLTDTNGVRHEISIPPPLIRPAAIAQMRAAAERLIAPQLRAIVRLIGEPILQPIYDLESPRMAFGRVAIIGDAAFVARPHVGAGVAKAADDAAALVAALAGEPEITAALRRFEAERLPVNCKIIARARHLGAYLQASQTEEERAYSQRHSIPAAVLAETAVLDFLQASEAGAGAT
ncbi:MAG: FAD-dependent monooxygenase [Proteobacteria bacterium]|nr:FAD-dependent monooxygenase [Pseudomonadota bacterium]